MENGELLDSYTFPKSERIVSQKLIDELFTSGQSHSLTAFPLRAVYLYHTALTLHLQILISVPKRRFKHAVDRNHVKRQIREAYRKHKQLVYDSLSDGQSLAIAFIWLSDRHYPSMHIEACVKSLLERIANKANNPT